MRPRTHIVALLAAAALRIVPAAAQEVGTATAVNPLSQGSTPERSLVALSVGARIVHKERIQTTSAGTVQLLFLDKSTLSIAPNSNLLIDEYVYDPASGSGHSSGHMATSLAEGALRYVGGLLSHAGEAEVTTPVASIGIRGGTVTVMHDSNGTRVINHYGVITVQNGAGSVVIRRPGFAVTVLDAHMPPSQPERVGEAEIKYHLKRSTSQPGQNGGVPNVDEALLAQFGIGGLVGTIDPDVQPIFADNGESKAFQIIIQATHNGTYRFPPPPPPPPPPYRPPP